VRLAPAIAGVLLVLLAGATLSHDTCPPAPKPVVEEERRKGYLECGSTPAHLVRVYHDAAMAFLPGDLREHWCWLALQGRAESAWRADAKSVAGAMGIAQFMPGTWRETCSPRFGPNPYAVVPAIHCQAVYMGKQADFWIWRRPAYERLLLATAGYNAGNGNVHRAQKLCRGARLWGEIRTCLPRVTGRHARETTGYVDRIERWYEEAA